jgi:FAD/FMN-containing dehydrogenase
VSAVSWGRNRIDVFAASREPGNPLQHWWSDGGGFALESLGGSLVQGTVSAVSHAADRLDVFGISGDGRIAHWQWDGQSWTGPDHRGDNIPAGDVSAVVRVQRSLQPSLPVRPRLDVFVAGAGNSLRQWPGGGLENATAQRWINWPTNHEVNPGFPGILRPDSLDELVNIVREAEQLGRGVRAVGTGWSNSDVAVSPAYVIETDRLDNVLTEVLSTSLASNVSGEQRSRLVHVEAGIKLHALNALLDRRNLALKTMGGASGQSLAGVVSTSAHGIDFDRGPIPDMVRAIHLVGPEGAQHWIEPSTAITDKAKLQNVLGIDPANIHYDDEWFDSVLVSMGSMGILYSLIVEVVPQHDLIGNCERLDWDEAKTRLRAAGTPDDPFDGMRGLQLVIQPYARSDGSRACYLTRRIEAPATAASTGQPDPESWARGISLGLMRTLKATRSEIDNTVWDVTELQVKCNAQRGFAHTIMGGPAPPPVVGLTVELVFDATNTRYLEFIDAALEILRKAFQDEREAWGYLGWISLRFQGRSRAHLSPHRFSRSCTVEFAAAWRIPLVEEWPDTPILIARLEAKGRELGGIQHWGLNNEINRVDIGRAYPRLDTWRRVRWELTKGGTIRTFDSDFTRRCGLSDLPLPAITADYDNDRKTDFAVWRPGTGTWWIIDSSTGAQRTQQWGRPGDVPVPGRYDSDKRTDFAIWRPDSATWIVRPSSGGNKRTQQWGQTGDIPVPGDYDGDGRTDFAVWRPASGEWFVIHSSGKQRPPRQLGEAGDIPVPGDYDGDGRTDFAVWRPNSGTWHVIDSLTGTERAPQQWGQPGDIPVPGDYDGDGKTDLAVWRPSTGVWHVIESSTGNERAVQFGEAGDIPVQCDYDGDGRTDFAVWRPGTGTWWIIDSSTGAERSQQWGQRGDIPV